MTAREWLDECEKRASANPEHDDPKRPNLDAYYYCFDKTCDAAVDGILSAVAAAGKAFHHTEEWGEDAYNGLGTPVEWIQRAANRAAAARSDVPRLVAICRVLMESATPEALAAADRLANGEQE